MMKYLCLFISVFIWYGGYANMALRPRIDTAKYNIANQKFKDLKVKSEKLYSNEGKENWYISAYDTLGRIVAVYDQLFYGKRYQYLEKNDTITKIEYESKKEVITDLNKIEKFIYNTSGKVKTYTLTYKKVNINYNRTKLYEDTIIIIEMDKLYYNSLQRIVKIEHYSKSFLNQDLHLELSLPIDDLQLVSTDTFKYDTRQITAVRTPSDSSNTEILYANNQYDSRNRLISETTVCTFHGTNYSDTVDVKYVYEGSKVTRMREEPYPGMDTWREIRTEYYNKSGLLVKLTSLRVRLKIVDKLFFKYEFY